MYQKKERYLVILVCVDQKFTHELHGFYYAFSFTIANMDQCNKNVIQSNKLGIV